MIHGHIFEAIDTALAILPPAMSSKPARAMLLAMGLQESRFKHRRQIRGPARGYWQFEMGGGVRGVLNHHATAKHARHLLQSLNYDPDKITLEQVYDTLEHNDVLAAGFARLLLWTLPASLPQAGEHQRSWEQYISAWRPGKPHRQTWDAFYDTAWGHLND